MLQSSFMRALGGPGFSQAKVGFPPGSVSQQRMPAEAASSQQHRPSAVNPNAVISP